MTASVWVNRVGQRGPVGTGSTRQRLRLTALPCKVAARTVHAVEPSPPACRRFSAVVAVPAMVFAPRERGEHGEFSRGSIADGFALWGRARVGRGGAGVRRRADGTLVPGEAPKERVCVLCGFAHSVLTSGGLGRGGTRLWSGGSGR